MEKAKIVRWAEWNGEGVQHVVLTRQESGLSAEAAIVGADPAPFAARVLMAIDDAWLARRIEVSLLGGGALTLESDGQGRWRKDGAPMPELDGTLEPDLSVTPLTNTFPIKRLRLAKGQSAEIRTAYVDVPKLEVFADPQRYSCLEEGRRYLYESLDSDFRREIEIDDDDLVVIYPGLFRRLL